MEQERYYFRVGMFVSIAIALVVITLFAFAGSKNSDADQVTYAIYFQGSVDGVSLGSPVKLKGIQVGTVKEIAFSKGQNDMIRVLVDIMGNAPVRSDTVASMQLQGITGTSIVALENTSNTIAPRIEKKDSDEYLIIASRQSPLERVSNSVPDMIDQMTKLARQGQMLLAEENIAAVHDAIMSINQSAQSMNKIMGGKNNQSLESALLQLNELLSESKLTMREMRMLTRTIREDPSIVLHGTKQDGLKVKP